MTMYVICAVRDAAVDVFGTPIFVRATGEALRSFADEVNREGSVFNAHPEDYELYLIGSYDDQSAAIAFQSPSSLVTGKAAYRAKEK